MASRRPKVQRDAEKDANAVQSTIGSILVGVLGVIVAAATASSESALNTSPVTWLIITWTLAGMGIVGLWPLIRRFLFVRRRVHIAGAALLAALVASTTIAICIARGSDADSRTSPLIDTSGWKPDGTDPIFAGCRRLNGKATTGSSVEIPRGDGRLGVFSISYNTYPTCGLIWAEFLTPRGADGNRISFHENGIAEIRLELVRSSPLRKESEVWNFEQADQEGKTDQDLWTHAMNLGSGGDFHATAVIRLTNNTILTERLTARPAVPVRTPGTSAS